jgi:hypothetical protein
MPTDDADISPEFQGQFKMAGLIDKMGKGAADYITQAMATAAKGRAAGMTEKEIAKETGGVAQIGLHGEPMAIVPHGEVNVPKFTEPLKKEIPFGEMYQSKNLDKAVPALSNIPVAPDPNMRPGNAAFVVDKIHVNPNLVLDPTELKRVLAHEGGAHAAARLTSGVTDPGRYAPLGGGSPSYIAELSDLPLHEQIKYAANIRAGMPHLYESLSNSPRFQHILGMGDRDFKKLRDLGETMRMHGRKGTGGIEPYRRTYGEQLARWMENPEGGREVLGTIPHQTPSWTGPRTMAATPQERIRGLHQHYPSSSIMANDFIDVIDQYLTTKVK